MHKVSVSSNITRKHLSKFVESFADDIKGGTETERNNKQYQQNILDALKENQIRPASSLSKPNVKHFNRSVNENSESIKTVLAKK